MVLKPVNGVEESFIPEKGPWAPVYPVEATSGSRFANGISVAFFFPFLFQLRSEAVYSGTFMCKPVPLLPPGPIPLLWPEPWGPMGIP